MQSYGQTLMWNNQGVIYVEIVLNVSLKCVYCFRSKQILRLNEFISIHKNKIWFYGTAKSSAAVATFVDILPRQKIQRNNYYYFSKNNKHNADFYCNNHNNINDKIDNDNHNNNDNV